MRMFFMDGYEIVDAINSEDEFGGLIDDYDLFGESWREICRAYRLYFEDVDPIAWRMLCARRGKILYRLRFSHRYHRYYG